MQLCACSLHAWLTVAVAGGKTSMVRFLLDRGADPNLPGRVPPLWLAERTDIASLLIDRGAAIDARDANGMTALMVAVGLARSEVAALLIRRGASLDARDQSGRTVMHHAAKGNSPAIVGALMDAGAVANQRDAARQYPLHNVGEREGPPSAAIVALLLKAGNPVDAEDAQQITPLCLLAGGEDAAQALLDAGADPNAPCRGHGPLYAAVSRGNRAAVDLLLARGAKPPVEGAAAKRMLCHAQAKGLTELADRIRAAGVSAACEREGAASEPPSTW
jgi:ankyrin repeat protein